MIIPPALKFGDKVGFVNASSYISPEDRDCSIQAFEKLGFKVSVGESCKGKYGYFGATDEIRANDINSMFADPTIKAVICIRGGYGTPRILDRLDYELISQNPKPLCGYSDVTGLHLAINKLSGLVTYHSPMPYGEFSRGIDEYSFQVFQGVVMSEKPYGKLYNYQNAPFEIYREGVAQGPLAGGNLSLICALMGTPYEIEAKGKILFIEDVGEDVYRLDRMLTTLRLAGKFKECAGIVFGGFTNCGHDKDFSIQDIIRDIVVPCGKPVIGGLTCGHMQPTATLPLGAMAKIDSAVNYLELL